MKRVIALSLLGMFAVSALVGCEASAKVDTDGDSHSSMSKTTVRTDSPRGESKTTETRTTVNP